MQKNEILLKRMLQKTLEGWAQARMQMSSCKFHVKMSRYAFCHFKNSFLGFYLDSSLFLQKSILFIFNTVPIKKKVFSDLGSLEKFWKSGFIFEGVLKFWLTYRVSGLKIKGICGKLVHF